MSLKVSWLVIAGVIAAGCGGGAPGAGAGEAGAGGLDAAAPLFDATTEVVAADGAPVSALGDAAGAAALGSRPMKLELGSVLLGASAVSMTATIFNGGGDLSGVPAVTVTGGGFRLVTTDCLAPLRPVEECTVKITFSPTALGPHAGMLAVSASPGGVVQVPLTGQGASGAAMVLPASGDFRAVVVGQMSRLGTFTLSNTGGTPFPAITIELQGDDYSFSTSSECHAPIPPGGTCVIEVRFEPRSPGVKPGVLIVMAGNETVKVPLTGAGLAPPVLLVTPMSQSFAAAVGTSGAAVVFSAGNVGDAASGPITAKLTGADAAEFHIVAGDCGSPLPSFESCHTSVVFRPLSAGMKTASLLIEGMPGGSASAALSGLASP